MQIRVTADLYPGSRSALGGGVDHPEIPAGRSPCSIRHKGKVSHLLGNLLTGSFLLNLPHEVSHHSHYQNTALKAYGENNRDQVE